MPRQDERAPRELVFTRPRSIACGGASLDSEVCPREGRQTLSVQARIPAGQISTNKFICIFFFTGQCPFQGNGRVYVVSEAAALRQFLCFLPVLHAHPPGRGDTVDTIRVSFSLSLPVPLLPGQACAPAELADRDSTAVAKLR